MPMFLFSQANTLRNTILQYFRRGHLWDPKLRIFWKITKILTKPEIQITNLINKAKKWILYQLYERRE